MGKSTVRSPAIFAFLALLGLCSLSCKAGQPACLGNWIAPGQRTVTPAQVTGAPSEHLQLHGRHPEDSTSLRQDMRDEGYLITGDKVDLITSCAGFAYVRFHGAKRISTGWVEEARIQTMGKPYRPLAPNAGILCKAAEDTLNENYGNGSLKPLPLSTLPPDVLTRLQFDQMGTAQVTHVKVEGRPIALVSIETGGTCESSEAIALTDDLKARLSPNDIDDRNIRNTGQNLWSFGVSETLVEVLGQPMVLSTGSGGDTSFYLSLVDKNGDIVPACNGERGTADPRIQTSADDRVCDAMLSNKQTEIPMTAPTGQEKLVLSKLDSSFTPSNNPDSNQSTTSLSFNDGSRAARATYTLEKTALVDIDNSGHARRVGFVSFEDGDSSAGCGDFSERDMTPVYIDDRGVADPAAPVNKLFGGLGQDMSDAAFVKYEGKTYLKLMPSGDNPIEIWKIESTGPKQICTFQIRRYTVSPITQ
jgi:hypothetical protein